MIRGKGSAPEALLRFLHPYPPFIRHLALETRGLVLRQVMPTHENIYDAYNAVTIGFGTSDRLKDGICHVAVYAKHVNLGLNHGADLPDPEGVLEGQGARVRHVTVRTLDDLASPALCGVLEAACAHAGHVPRARRPPLVSTVKSIYPNRKRPARAAG